MLIKRYPWLLAVIVCLGCPSGLWAACPADSTVVDGGTIAGNDRDTLFFQPSEPGDGFVIFTTTSAQDGRQATYSYVITTATPEPVILGVIAGDNFDFGAVSLDEVRVYGISYVGMPLFEVGYPVGPLPLADGCYAVSDNFVTVFNREDDGGPVSTVGGVDPTSIQVSLTTFPNPVSGSVPHVTIEVFSGPTRGQLSVLSADGRRVADYFIGTSSTETFSVPTGNLVPGTYVVVYATSTFRVFTRFIKQ